MPRTIDDVDVQKNVVMYMINHLGDDIWSSHTGSRVKSGKYELFEHIHKYIAHGASVPTICRWWDYFLEHGETQAQKRHRDRLNGGKRRKHSRYKGAWGPYQTDLLEEIINDYPEFYLDEIRERLYQVGGGWWSSSYVWKRLTQIGYSLQVASDRAYEIDEDEREEYKQAILEIVLHGKQFIYLDETARGKNASRKRRLWSRRGQTPFRYVYFNGIDDVRYTMLAACDIDGFLLEACEIIEPKRGPNDNEPVPIIFVVFVVIVIVVIAIVFVVVLCVVVVSTVAIITVAVDIVVIGLIEFVLLLIISSF